MPQLATVCSQLGLRAFSEWEYKFLLEYCTITKPLTKALDRLQGENKVYVGSCRPMASCLYFLQLNIWIKQVIQLLIHIHSFQVKMIAVMAICYRHWSLWCQRPWHCVPAMTADLPDVIVQVGPMHNVGVWDLLAVNLCDMRETCRMHNCTSVHYQRCCQMLPLSQVFKIPHWNKLSENIRFV